MKQLVKTLRNLSFVAPLLIGACTKSITPSKSTIGGQQNTSQLNPQGLNPNGLQSVPQCSPDRPLPTYLNSRQPFVFYISCTNPNNSALELTCQNFQGSGGGFSPCTLTGGNVLASLAQGTPTGEYLFKLKVRDPSVNHTQVLHYNLKVDNEAPVVSPVYLTSQPTSSTASLEFSASDPTTPPPSSGLKSVCYKLVEDSTDHTVAFDLITPVTRSECLGSASPHEIHFSSLDPSESYKIIFQASDYANNFSDHKLSVLRFSTTPSVPGTCTISAFPQYLRSAAGLEASFVCAPPTAGPLSQVCTLQGNVLSDPGCADSPGSADLSSAAPGSNEFCVRAHPGGPLACRQFFIDGTSPSLAVNVSQVTHNTGHFEFTANDPAPTSGIESFACAIETPQGDFVGGPTLSTIDNDLASVLTYGNCQPCSSANSNIGCLDVNSSILESNADYTLHLRVRDRSGNASSILTHDFKTHPLAPVVCSILNPYSLTASSTPSISYQCQTSSVAILNAATCSLRNQTTNTLESSGSCDPISGTFTPSSPISVSDSYHIYRFEVAATTNFGVSGGASMDFSIDLQPPTIPTITSTSGPGSLQFNFATISDNRAINLSSLQCLLERDDLLTVGLNACTLSSVLASSLDRNHQYRLKILVQDQAGNGSTRESAFARPGLSSTIAPPTFSNLMNMSTPVRTTTSSADVSCSTPNTTALCQVLRYSQMVVDYSDCASPQVIDNTTLGFGPIQLRAKCVDNYDADLQSTESVRDYVHACPSLLSYISSGGVCQTCPNNSVPDNTFTGCYTCSSTQLPDPSTGTCMGCPTGFVASHAIGSCYKWVPKADWVNPSNHKIYERKGCKSPSDMNLANCPLEVGYSYFDASAFDEIKLKTDGQGNPICASGYVRSGQNCVLPSWGPAYAAPSGSHYNQRRQCSHGTLCANLPGWNHFVSGATKFAHRCINGGRPNGPTNCKPPIGYVDSGHHCSSTHAVVDASARGGNGGITRYNQLRSQGAPLPAWKNPYYADGSGLNYANDGGTRLVSCWMNGYQRVVNYQGSSWSSPEDNAVLMWNGGNKRFQIKRGSTYNNWLSNITCGGRLHSSCIHEWQWIFK